METISSSSSAPSVFSFIFFFDITIDILDYTHQLIMEVKEETHTDTELGVSDTYTI